MYSVCDTVMTYTWRRWLLYQRRVIHVNIEGTSCLHWTLPSSVAITLCLCLHGCGLSFILDPPDASSDIKSRNRTALQSVCDWPRRKATGPSGQLEEQQNKDGRYMLRVLAIVQICSNVNTGLELSVWHYTYFQVHQDVLSAKLHVYKGRVDAADDVGHFAWRGA